MTDIDRAQILDLNTRYFCAYTEINGRIAQRQNVLTLYITLMTGGVGAAVLVPNSPIDLSVLLYFVPFATLIFALLRYAHDKIIENLVTFLVRCEQKHPKEFVLPNYFTGPF